MSEAMEIDTAQEVLLAHQETVVRHLAYKLQKLKLPPRIFPSGRYPNIIDIYKGMSSIDMPYVPDFIGSFAYVMANYNIIAAHGYSLGFQARKQEQDLNIAQAIWYWQLDMQHSFASRAHGEVRFNALLGLILYHSTDAQTYITQQQKFACAFVDAWYDYNNRLPYTYNTQNFIAHWQHGEYDLITWSNKARRRMRAEVIKLQNHVQDMNTPFPVDEYFKSAADGGPKRYSQQSPAWAMQYLLFEERENAEMDILDRHADAEETDIDSLCASLGLNDVPAAALSEPLFRQNLVQAILAPIDENVHGSPAQNQGQPWLRPDLAEMIITTYIRSETRGVQQTGRKGQGQDQVLHHVVRDAAGLPPSSLPRYI